MSCRGRLVWEWEPGLANGRAFGLEERVTLPSPSCSLADTRGFLQIRSQHHSCVPSSCGRKRVPKSLRAVGPVVLSIPSRQPLCWPGPGMSCMSPPGPWAVRGKQGTVPVMGRLQLQAEQAKVMLFPGFLLPILWSPACSPHSRHCKGGRGDWAGGCSCGPPAASFTPHTPCSPSCIPGQLPPIL